MARNAYLAKEMEFNINSYFILGFPTDTEESIKKTIQYAKSMPFDMCTFFVMKPLPGSKVFEDWARDKNLENLDWTMIDFHNATNNVSQLSTEKIRKWYDRAFKSTIITRLPQYIFFRFVKYGRWYQLKFLIRNFIYFMTGFGVNVITKIEEKF